MSTNQCRCPPSLKTSLASLQTTFLHMASVAGAVGAPRSYGECQTACANRASASAMLVQASHARNSLGMWRCGSGEIDVGSAQLLRGPIVVSLNKLKTLRYYG